mmetsp:Transcript_48624/g.66065  ORF Transcript_48624/g.66065 Transcript_48624/m.66065 type:complete len:222 (+) Transcript_48624:844-1509(+)
MPGLISATMETTAATATSATTATVQRNELRSSLLTRNKLIVMYLISIAFFTFGFRKYGDHGKRLLVRNADLKEWVLVLKTFLTHAAVVKVFADTALVANTVDSLVTTIALSVVHGTLLYNSFFLFLKVKVFASKQLIEDLLGLLVKFSFDKVLESLARNSFSTKGTIFTLLLAVLLAFILHFSEHVDLFRLLLLLNRGLGNDRFLSDGILALNDELDGTVK